MRNGPTGEGADDEIFNSRQMLDSDLAARHRNPGSGSLFGSENDFGSFSKACHI